MLLMEMMGPVRLDNGCYFNLPGEGNVFNVWHGWISLFTYNCTHFLLLMFGWDNENLNERKVMNNFNILRYDGIVKRRGTDFGVSQGAFLYRLV